MPRFFVSAGDVRDGCARIAGADAAHLARSLRARRGERIVVVDDSGVEHGILLDTVDADAVTGTVEWSRPATGEPRCRVLVLQALAAEGMDEAVEALAETGAAEIWPLLTERTVARPDARRAAGRVERWSAIARQAAALAGRAGPMPVRPIRSLADALEDLPTDTRIVALTTTATSPLAAAAIDAAQPVALVVGPEGGLGPRDRDALVRAGAAEHHLGPRVLRTRLAGSVALGILLARTGDLDGAVAAPPRAMIGTGRPGPAP